MSKYDYRDPGTDPAYTDRLGGHPGIERHCRDCGAVVFVDRDGAYQMHVVCQRCEDASEARASEPKDAA